MFQNNGALTALLFLFQLDHPVKTRSSGATWWRNTKPADIPTTERAAAELVMDHETSTTQTVSPFPKTCPTCDGLGEKHIIDHILIVFFLFQRPAKHAWMDHETDINLSMSPFFSQRLCHKTHSQMFCNKNICCNQTWGVDISLSQNDCHFNLWALWYDPNVWYTVPAG